MCQTKKVEIEKFLKRFRRLRALSWSQNAKSNDQQIPFFNRVGVLRLDVFTVTRRPSLVTKNVMLGFQVICIVCTSLTRVSTRKVVSIKNTLSLETSRQKPKKNVEVANTTDSTTSKTVPLTS